MAQKESYQSAIRDPKSAIKTVLYIITDLDFGGTERQLGYLLRNLNKNAYRPVILSLKKGGRLALELRQEGFEVHLTHSALNLFSIWSKLNQIVADHDPKIIHAFLFRANMAGRLFARMKFRNPKSRPKVISSIRVWDERWVPFQLEKWTKNWSDFHIFNSEIILHKYVEKMKIEKKRCFTVPNAIDTAPFAQALTHRQKTRQALRFEPGDQVIISVGRLDEQKGFPYLIEAFDLIRQKIERTKLLIVGDGPMRDNLMSLIKSKHMIQAAFILGYRNDVPELLAGADCMALASLWEGSPNVILEAWAGKIPVVATSVGGTGDLIKEQSHNGLLVVPGNPDALAQAILKILQDDGLAQALIRGGQASLAPHQPGQMSKNVQAIYDNLLR